MSWKRNGASSGRLPSPVVRPPSRWNCAPRRVLPGFARERAEPVKHQPGSLPFMAGSRRAWKLLTSRTPGDSLTSLVLIGLNEVISKVQWRSWSDSFSPQYRDPLAPKSLTPPPSSFPRWNDSSPRGWGYGPAVRRETSGVSFGPAIANSSNHYVISSKPVNVSDQQLHAVMGAPVR